MATIWHNEGHAIVTESLKKKTINLLLVVYFAKTISRPDSKFRTS